MRPQDITPEHARALDRQARRVALPCGDGSMVWRGWGQGTEAVLLLHGGAGSWVHWIRNIEALAAHYTVWTPDFPGMGESALPPEPWTPQSMADITAAGMQQVWGVQPFAVVGFSFGAMIGGHLAAQYPDRVRCLVIASAGGTGMAKDPSHRMRPWRQETDPVQRLEIHRTNMSRWMLDSEQSVDALALAVLPGAIEADRLRNRQVSRTDTLLKVLPQLRCPVYGIWGENDVMYRHVRAELALALKDAGVASLQFIPCAGHWVPYERATEFNAEVLRILQHRAVG